MVGNPMATNYQTETYGPRLKVGLEYQDFICMKLHARGIILQNIQSKKYQLKRENLLGMEIKFDDRFAETGNLYIETHEKSDPARPNYVPSGINRDDESWLYGMGNYNEFFIFSKRFLKSVDAAVETRQWPGVVRKQIATSKGFLLPKEFAVKWCERHFEF